MENVEENEENGKAKEENEEKMKKKLKREGGKLKNVRGRRTEKG